VTQQEDSDVIFRFPGQFVHLPLLQALVSNYILLLDRSRVMKFSSPALVIAMVAPADGFFTLSVSGQSVDSSLYE
jgi:hypothetical protein